MERGGERGRDEQARLFPSRQREREKEREAPVISCVNVTTSPFCSDTGADGQFAPLYTLAVFLLERPAGALRQPSHRTRLTCPISN